MKVKSIIVMVLLFFVTTAIGCNNSDIKDERDESTDCKNREILLILENEPAQIQRGCYDFPGAVDSFAIVLLRDGSRRQWFGELYPLGGVPEEFQVDGLYVLISGNVLKCREISSCAIPYSHPWRHMFELESIQINEQGACSRWDISNVLITIQNEPAFLRRGCNEESHLFYIELISVPQVVHWITSRIFPCNGIPEDLQIDDLSVLVSGNILRDGKFNACNLSRLRFVPNNIFELETIKKNEE